MVDQPRDAVIVLAFTWRGDLLWRAEWLVVVQDTGVEFCSFDSLAEAMDSCFMQNAGYYPAEPFAVRHRYFDRKKEIDEFEWD